MNFREKTEEQMAEDRRKHELKMAKIELAKIKASRPENEYSLGKLAIKCTCTSICVLIAGFTVCGSIPKKQAKNSEKEILSTILGVASDRVQDSVAIIIANAEALKTASQKTQLADSTK